MSYVLEALKKAESQRERGAVPNLHARPLMPPTVVGPAGAAGRSWRGLAALLAGGVLLAGAVALWWTTGRGGAEPAPVPAASIEPDRTLPPAPAPPPPTPAAAIIAPAPPAPLANAGALAPPAPRAPVPEPRARPAERNGEAARPAAPATSAAEDRIYLPEELPDDIRRSLPALTIGGAVHSPNPANRILILNGQMFHEDDSVAPGLTLERIALNSAVLRTRGYRYRLNY